MAATVEAILFFNIYCVMFIIFLVSWVNHGGTEGTEHSSDEIFEALTITEGISPFTQERDYNLPSPGDDGYPDLHLK